LYIPCVLVIDDDDDDSSSSSSSSSNNNNNNNNNEILKSELNARNKITAIGALAVPVLRYSFGIINWRIEDIKKLTEKPERY